MLLLVFTLLVTPPDTLHLATCYREAEAHHPRRQELALQEAITELRVRNLNTQYLPALALSGQAVYQSDIPEILLDLPGGGLLEISKDQYKAAVSVDQVIYDGGRIAQQKAVEATRGALARQQVEVDLYGVREQVNTAFFGVLLSQAQQASLATLEADVQAKLGVTRAQVREGVALAGNADMLAAQLIQIQQQQAEAEANRLAGLDVLSTLIGRPLDADVVLALPPVGVHEADLEDRQRPEYDVFALTREQLAQQADLAARKNQPQVGGFAEAAYGRPQGLNFFENTFGPFYSFGVRVRWPFWDWQASRREREALALQQEAVEAQEAAFTQRLRIATQQQQREIDRLRELMARDEEIIELRERVVAQAASQLENGVITATAYLTERTAAFQAELTRQVHQIQLMQAQVRYLTTLGQQIEEHE